MASDESSSVVHVATLARLLEEHRSRLLAMVRRRIDPSLAVRVDPEEILNDAFLAARRRWAKFKAQSSMTPYAWLYRIVLDCLIEAWRRDRRGRRDQRREMPWPEQSSIQLGLNLVAGGTSPSGAVMRGELRERVQQMLQLLGERDREILWMRHYDRLSFKEAGAVLGITENTASVRYARALRRLKDLWLRTHPGKGVGE